MNWRWDTNSTMIILASSDYFPIMESENLSIFYLSSVAISKQISSLLSLLVLLLFTCCSFHLLFCWSKHPKADKLNIKMNGCTSDRPWDTFHASVLSSFYETCCWEFSIWPSFSYTQKNMWDFLLNVKNN